MGNRGQFEDRAKERERERAKTPDIARCVWCNKAVGEPHISCIHGEGEVTPGQASKPPVAAWSRPNIERPPSEQAQRADAKLVRDAINAFANDSEHCGWWGALAERESDAILSRLRRYLK
jgi:hypothetical protein